MHRIATKRSSRKLRGQKERVGEKRRASMSYARPSPIWSSPTSLRLHPPRSHTPTRPGQSALYSPDCREKVFSETRRLLLGVLSRVVSLRFRRSSSSSRWIRQLLPFFTHLRYPEPHQRWIVFRSTPRYSATSLVFNHSFSLGNPLLIRTLPEPLFLPSASSRRY